MDIVGAVLVSGTTAAVVACWGILTQRAIARRRTTFDHLAKSNADGDIVRAQRKFIELARSPGGLPQWATADREDAPEVEAIRLVLNEFELISIGIQRGIIDVKLYQRWFKSGVIRYWGYASPFVHVLRERTGNDMLFHEFEEMAGWFRENKRPKRRWWIGRIF